MLRRSVAKLARALDLARLFELPRSLFGIVLLFGLARAVEPAHGYSGGWGFPRRHAGEPAAPPPAQPVVVIKDPFFCYPHNLGFRSEADFFEHLRTTHHVSREHSLAHLLRIDERLVFFSF